MKRILFVKISILNLCLFIFSACTKNDSPYYDYVNSVQTYDGSALDYLQSQPEGTFDSLLLILDRYPHLQDSLKNQQLTLFAPTNENFAASIKYLNIERKRLGRQELSLSTVDGDMLEKLLCKYIVRGNRNTDAYVDERDGLLVSTLIYGYPMHIQYLKKSSSGFLKGGASVLNYSNPFGSVFTKDWITTTTKTVNINTNNATVNILTTIHNFGFDEFTKYLNN